MAENPNGMDGGGGSPLTMKALRIASLVLACAGLFFLYLYSVQPDFPMVRVGDVTPAMNFACILISGEIVRGSSATHSGGWVFTVDDGSGEIAVFCSRTQTEALKAAGQIPRRGDRIETVGSLNAGVGQGVRLRLLAPERMRVLRRDLSADRSAAGSLGLAIASYEWMAAITLVVVAFVFLPRFLKAGTRARPANATPVV